MENTIGHQLQKFLQLLQNFAHAYYKTRWKRDRPIMLAPRGLQVLHSGGIHACRRQSFETLGRTEPQSKQAVLMISQKYYDIIEISSKKLPLDFACAKISVKFTRANVTNYR